ncbi:hypothetical protein KP509_34G042300 [Ceratopteris richardii]|uniref:Uncharacterized protein n=1 Tax=Ceratopteris richardii TaxID=49495 RepID=A0A8T2QJU1_CERRI|nr:hypothetical protein KP509_34G042300 [Ceratopteris richardii]KAH7284169.1 hypothetical protein KP509_34G042300 [Ceratopteris richardii]
MAERRASWPWRKKSMVKVEKAIQPPVQVSSPPRSVKYEAGLPSAVNGTQETLTPVTVDDARFVEAVRFREHAESKLTALREELSNALKDVESKEAMAKKHEKVMEDAVAGWEKAEKEALSFKKELEASSKQKAILEDRVAHLDGALKECMKQVRLVKEEQERKIEETIVSKTKEWERIKAEVDAKQVELERRLMESEAQNAAMGKSLQERAKKILEANEAKEKAETHVKVLQVKIGSLEKEVSALKYELHVLNKELEIRNEEVECNKKAADAAHKQHLDNVKKVAKLEADCQRLRNLIRKKLPGPAAIAQMRREVEGPSSRDSLSPDMKRRPVKSLLNVSISPTASCQSDLSISNPEVEMLKERMSSMEEETKLLKEALSKRNEELYASRILCAKTASKLSLAEGQIESLQGSPIQNGFESGASMDISAASASEEGVCSSIVEEASCAESWASALISELALFKKEKRESNYIDEYAEETPNIVNTHESAVNVGAEPVGVNSSDNLSNEDTKETIKPSKAGAEVRDLDFLCRELSLRFNAMEEQLRSFTVEKGDSDTAIAHNFVISLSRARETLAQLEKNTRELEATRNKSDSNVDPIVCEDDHVVSSLGIVLSKLIVLLESLLPRCKRKSDTFAHSESPSEKTPSEEETEASEGALSTAWTEQKQALVSSKDSFLEGKSTISEFLIQFGIILCEACDSETTDLDELLTSMKGQSGKACDVSTSGFLSEMAVIRDWLQKLTDGKGELEKQMASLTKELEATKLELDESKRLAMELQGKVAGMENVEKALADTEAIKLEVEGKLEAAQGEINDLQARVTSLIQELTEEKKNHQETASKCAEIEGQLKEQRSIREDECNGLKLADFEEAQLTKERELVSAKEKLAECQRTIFALGKQLSALSSPPMELSPRGSFDTVSMDSSSTLAMEQKMQMELHINGGSSMEHHVEHHQSYQQSHANGDVKYFNHELTSNGRRNGYTMQPSSLPSGWSNVSSSSSSRGMRAFNEDVQETPRSWTGAPGSGSFSKAGAVRTKSYNEMHQEAAPPLNGNGGSFLRVGGRHQPIAEMEHPPAQHYTAYQPQTPHGRRTSYVSPNCQYGQQRHFDTGPAWAPAYLPEDDEEGLGQEVRLGPNVYSPPHTALSSPARSPARYVQQLGAVRGSVRTLVHTGLTESINAATPSGRIENNNFNGGTDGSRSTPSKPSALGKLFSRSKHHR